MMLLVSQPCLEDVTVRRATPDDAEELQAMVEEIAAEEGFSDAVHVTAAHWRRVLELPDVVVLFAVDGEQPLGYVSAVRQLNLWVGGPILALDDLYVRPHARNRSVGRRLMHHLAGIADADELLIRWEMQHDNHDAQRFYRRLGARLRTKVIAAWTPEGYRTGTAEIPGIDPSSAFPAQPARG
jgi:ribosomal protein S18 acetylase RimI-like enzyme